MKILRNIAVRIIPVGIMTFLIVAAIAYQRGVYDITFIERPSTDTAAVSDTVDTEPADTIAPEITETAPPETMQPPEDTTPPEVTEDPAKEAIEAFLSSLNTTADMKSRGYAITDTEYDTSSYLTRLETSYSIANKFSLRNKIIEVPERIMDEQFGNYTTVMNTVSVSRPLVEVYMDYLLVDNGGTVDVLSKDGSVLFRSFDADTYVPAYTRDRNDAALFKTEEPSQSKYNTTITKYYALDDFGRLIESDYNDAADNRGLYINYPTYFGKSDNNYSVIYKDGTFGFGTSGTITTRRFTQAYNFSDGLAAVVDDEGELSYVQKWFYATITCGKHDYLNESRRRSYADYLLPDTKGIESVGFYYFDHGLVRIRKQEYDAWRWEHGSKEVNYDRDIVIRTDGTEFPIPQDYTVVSYSNGVFMLEKHGQYGFMDYTGKWIADPVYTYAEPFNEGLAMVEKDGVAGMIDTDGRFVIPMIFDYVSSVSGGIVAAYDETCGWVLFNKMQS